MATEFKLPDPKKTSGKILGVAVLGAFGLAIYAWVLPWLIKIAWGTVELGIAAVAAFIVLSIVTSKKFWRRCSIILEGLGELLFGWAVNMNPWGILEAQLTNADEDRQELKKQCETLKAQDDKLTTQLADEGQAMALAARKMTLCRDRLAQNPNDEQIALDLEASSNDYTNSDDFIKNVSPIATDIRRLVSQCDKAYIKSGYALQNARNRLAKQRAAYEAVSVGSNAMKRALKAFTGDSELNKAADIALNKLKTDISQKIGVIKNSIQLTSRIMNERDLNDAAKVSLAAEQVEQLNIDQNLDFVAQIGDAGAKIPVVQSNKWLNQLNK